MKKIKLLLIGMLCLISNANSQEIASYSSAQNSGCSGIIANDANVTVNGICRGSGITKAPGLGGPYKSRGWTAGTVIDTDDYLEWTVAPNAGYSLNLSAMSLKYGRTGNGPTEVEIQMDSGSGFATIFTDASVSSTGENNIIDLSAFTCITNTVTFRLFAFNASSSSGTFGIREFVASDKGVVINGTVIVPTCCASTTTWTTSGWDNGLPDLTKEVILASDYDTDDGNISACAFTINSGVRLLIRNNDHIEVQGDITNEGEIRMKPTASLVQKSNTALFINNSTARTPIVVTKKTAPLEEWYEYTYWSSPLQNVAIGDLLPTTSSSRLFEFNAANFSDVLKENLNDNVLVSGRDDIDDNADDWQFIPSSTIMEPGKGYSATLAPIDLAGVDGGTFGINKRFKGSVLNTGIINITANRNDDDTTNMDNNWNLIGNPFASAVDAKLFLEQNTYSATNTTGVLDGAIYFWSHVTPPSADTNGNEPLNFDVNDYAILNLTGNTAGERYAPDDFIPSGQGFFTSFSNDFSGTTGDVVFTNEMRVTGNNNKFFRNGNADNKLWLNLISDNGVYSQILVGYVSGASKTNDGSLYDANRVFSGDSAMLFSTIENDENEYAIQGRAPEDLTKNESIPIGITTAINSPTLYTLSIDHFKGGFFKRKNIYLKDHFEGITHNLKTNDYVFTSDIGIFKDRFEIVFKEEANLNIGAGIVSIIELENHKVKFLVKTKHKIKTILILDSYGREIFTFRINKKNNVFNLSKLNRSVYVAKITLSDGTIISKQFLKK